MRCDGSQQRQADDPVENSGCSSTAFTLAELLIVLVIMTAALGGIYAIFRHAVGAESDIAAQWQRASAARLLADEIAATLEGAVILPETASLVAIVGDDGVVSLTCLSEAYVGPTLEGETSGGLQSRRYRWGFAESDRAGSVEMRALPYAGTRLLSPIAEADMADMEQIWNSVPPITIARGIDSLSILFRPASDPEADWKAEWSGNPGDVLIQIRVQVGSDAVDRTVFPRASVSWVSD